MILPHKYYLKTTFKEPKDGKKKKIKVGEKPCLALIELRILLQNEAG
jgi:hypothetical protein